MCSDDDDSVFRREDVPVAYRYEPPGATKAETIWLLASTNAVVVVIAKRHELDSRIMVDVKKVGKERRKVKYVTKDERRRLPLLSFLFFAETFTVGQTSCQVRGGDHDAGVPDDDDKVAKERRRTRRASASVETSKSRVKSH
jgi:hypothetical protein